MNEGIASSTQLCEPLTTLARHHLQRIAADDQPDRRRGREREHDRHRQQQEAEKDEPRDGQCHRWISRLGDGQSSASAPVRTGLAARALTPRIMSSRP